MMDFTAVGELPEQGRHVLLLPGREIIHYTHGSAPSQQRLREMRTDETGSARHDIYSHNSRHANIR